MCQKCVDSVKEFFPSCPDEEYHRFLMAATCYPFGGGDMEREQLRKHREAVGDDWRAAIALAEKRTREDANSSPEEAK